LGTIYQQLGNLNRADSLIGLALERRRALNPSPNRDVAEALIALGLLRVDQAQFESAERSIRDGLAMAKATLPPTHADVIKGTAALGRVLQERGQYDQAIPVLEQAVALIRA